MQKLMAIRCFIIFLSISFFGCGNVTTVPNRDANNKTANTANSTNPTNTKDESRVGTGNFLTKAAQSGITEISLGKLAAVKAQIPELKEFGQKMDDEHNKINNELIDLAGKANFRLPVDFAPEQQDLIKKLNELPAAQFDKAYVDAMIEYHEKDVKLFKDELAACKNEEIKNWITKTLPMIQAHLDTVKGIKSKMK